MTSKPVEADIILVGGTFVTMDPLKPRADAVAVLGGHFEAVGTDAEIRRMAGPRTRVIDLAGGSATPGLVDGHCHLYGLGKALEELSLRGLRSPEEAAAKVAEAARARPAGEWIQGRGWDQNLWATKEFPGHAPLDAAAPAHPVALRRIDGHALWANAAAMRAAGVTRASQPPPGGSIVRDQAGEPTGVFIDAAMSLIEDRIPPASPEVIRRRIEAAARTAVVAGLTGVHEMGLEDEVIAEYRKLAAEGKLPLRVYAMLAGEPKAIAQLATRKPDRDPDGTALFQLAGVKMYADGALGSRGAALLEPYADDPGNRGLVITPKEEIQRAAELAVANGWQVAVHAIGDRANRDVLDAYAAAKVPPERRFRIEHAQIVAPEDLPRFGAQGVVASMQATHATSDMPWAGERVGQARLAGAYAWRSMLAGGARLVGGSDFPVEEVPPLLGLWAATTRTDPEGKPAGGWLPEQKLTLEEAIATYTVATAWVSFQEHRRGRIAPGFVADLTVYDRELIIERLLQTQIQMTMVGGRVVYERPR